MSVEVQVVHACVFVCEVILERHMLHSGPNIHLQKVFEKEEYFRTVD